VKTDQAHCHMAHGIKVLILALLRPSAGFDDTKQVCTNDCCEGRNFFARCSSLIFLSQRRIERIPMLHPLSSNSRFHADFERAFVPCRSLFRHSVIALCSFQSSLQSSRRLYLLGFLVPPPQLVSHDLHRHIS